MCTRACACVMGALTWRMVSKMAKPDVTEPPGELMYIYIVFESSCGEQHASLSALAVKFGA